MTPSAIYVCDFCDQRNRAPAAPLTASQSLRCGQCHEPLDPESIECDDAEVADLEGGQP